MATKTQTDPKKAPKSGAKAAPKAAAKAVSAAAGTRGKATSAGRRKSTASAAAAASKASPSAPSAPANMASSSAATTPAKTAAPTPVTASEALRRPDLIQAVADRVSLKRSEAKMVFDVVLDEIGKALDANDEVIVPPLGKMMVKKRIDKPKGAMLTVKLKRAEADPTAGDVAPIGSPLAKPAEQG